LIKACIVEKQRFKETKKRKPSKTLEPTEKRRDAFETKNEVQGNLFVDFQLFIGGSF